MTLRPRPEKPDVPQAVGWRRVALSLSTGHIAAVDRVAASRQLSRTGLIERLIEGDQDVLLAISCDGPFQEYLSNLRRYEALLEKFDGDIKRWRHAKKRSDYYIRKCKRRKREQKYGKRK